MTTDEKHSFDGSTCNDGQQKPFQVVLIDIKKAANGEIHCVKRSLEENIRYVAISYRWGELEETPIDTQLGYLASITSFDVEDFYQLCATMIKEPDLKNMAYVWVDAICVNQSNHHEKRATIHHMTDIYERATWILAVPDLHAAYLRTSMAIHDQIMQSIRQYRSYIYHLVHLNEKQLHEEDAAFLDTINAPNDIDLRKLLTNYTDCFADGFIKSNERHPDFDPITILGHLYDNEQEEARKEESIRKGVGFYEANLTDEIKSLHHCQDALRCPLRFIEKGPLCIKSASRPFFLQQEISIRKKEWHQEIYQRSSTIRQAMHFLTDLVVDWSSRVWVISEFHISKKKNNLKFYFTQLASDDDKEVVFFRFDINTIPEMKDPKPDLVYQFFYSKLIKQLNKQILVEMMLKSKASKNEDRFYAIFPQFPEYRDLVRKEDLVKTWDTSSILSVKLTLYQVLNKNDKWDLLYLSCHGSLASMLPTFAASTIDWQYAECLQTRLDDFNGTISLCHDGSLYYLHLNPNIYEMASHLPYDDAAATRLLAHLVQRKQLETTLMTHVDVLLVARNGYGGNSICFVGNEKENVWIVGNRSNVIYDDIFYSDFNSIRIYLEL